MARQSAARSNAPTSSPSASRNTSTTSTATRRRSPRATGPQQASSRARTVREVEAPAAVVPPPADPAPRRNLNEDELADVWSTYKRTGDQNLRDLLLETYLPLVRMIAERLLQTLPRSIELDDLQSAGVFGLLDAIDGFDLERGIKFKTYCTTRIRGSILDELRSQDWVPRLVRLKAHKLEKSLRKLEGELGRKPNHFELAEELGVTVEELQATEHEANARAMFSLSEKWDDGDDDKDMEKVEILEDKKSIDPAQTSNRSDLFEVMTGNLTKRERLIVIMYYYEGLTMREIGEIMELTESRVCQIHTNVMARLRTQLDTAQLNLG